MEKNSFKLQFKQLRYFVPLQMLAIIFSFLPYVLVFYVYEKNFPIEGENIHFTWVLVVGSLLAACIAVFPVSIAGFISLNFFNKINRKLKNSILGMIAGICLIKFIPLSQSGLVFITIPFFMSLASFVWLGNIYLKPISKISHKFL